MEGGLNTYGYALQNPTKYIDFFGLDVQACFFPDAAAGFGHVGIGVVSGSGPTST